MILILIKLFKKHLTKFFFSLLDSFPWVLANLHEARGRGALFWQGLEEGFWSQAELD